MQRRQVKDQPASIMARPAAPRYAAIALVMAVFVGLVLRFDRGSGTDLTASYISCRLMVQGQPAHLYSANSVDFNEVSDPLWQQIARDRGIPSTTVLSAFVQTPLWPYVLKPLCGPLRFGPFQALFAVLAAVGFAALLWLAAALWAPRCFTPLWMAVMALLWLRADPLRDAMQLTQTHIFFLLLTLAAIVLAQRGRPALAGVLLASACIVKITPGLLVIYWLLRGYYKAAFSFILSLLGLTLLTVVLTGPHVFGAYLHSMKSMGDVLLLSRNNQSFAAWWAGFSLPAASGLSFHIYRLPAALKVLSLLLAVASTCLGAWCDRHLPRDSRTVPYGALLAIVGATLFTPIAWTHYFIFLAVPCILLLDRWLETGAWPLAAVIAIVFVLMDVPWLARHAAYLHLHFPDIVRGDFYAGLVCLVALAWLSVRPQLSTPGSEPPSSAHQPPYVAARAL